MASFSSDLHKVMNEQSTTTSLPTPLPSPTHDAPPAYTPHERDVVHPALGLDRNYEVEDDPSSTSLSIDAGTVIRGDKNVVPLSRSPLAEATRFSALLLAAIHKLNAKFQEQAWRDADGAPPELRVNLVIDAGLTIIGNHNMVGNTPLKICQESQSPATKVGDDHQAGKRKAERGEGEDETVAKRVRIL